jgi:hypothetical protein
MKTRLFSHSIAERNGYAKSGDFRCLACHNPVSGLSIVSGVHHRNHCPYCLWSRCLDLYAPGDRLSACKAAMRPVGLALKRVKKKYRPENPGPENPGPENPGVEKSGELLLVHFCDECGKVSLNRLAADDDSQALLETFEASLALEQPIQAALRENGIITLQAGDFHLIRARLFGRN